MRKTLFLSVLSLVFSLGLFGQQAAQAVNQVAAPPVNPWVILNFYSGTNLTDSCYAPQVQPKSTVFSVPVTLTSISVSSNTATINFASTSYLWQGAQVFVSGSATAALNGVYPVTAVSGSTATITTSGVSDGTYVDMKVQTYNPLLNAGVWAISVNVYNASNQLINSYWAGANQPSGSPAISAVPQNLQCSSRANY